MPSRTTRGPRTPGCKPLIHSISKWGVSVWWYVVSGLGWTCSLTGCWWCWGIEKPDCLVYRSANLVYRSAVSCCLTDRTQVLVSYKPQILRQTLTRPLAPGPPALDPEPKTHLFELFAGVVGDSGNIIENAITPIYCVLMPDNFPQKETSQKITWLPNPFRGLAVSVIHSPP